MVNKTSMMINVRYFAYGFDDKNELDIIEIDESTFLDVQQANGCNIEYERHTIFTNGVSQICLTVQNLANPIED